jgi:biopolymer transport protein ExbD
MSKMMMEQRKFLLLLIILFCICIVAKSQDSLSNKRYVAVDTSKNKCMVTVKTDGTIYFKNKVIKEKNLSKALQKDNCEIVVLHVNRDLVYGKVKNILSILGKGKYRIILETADK